MGPPQTVTSSPPKSSSPIFSLPSTNSIRISTSPPSSITEEYECYEFVTVRFSEEVLEALDFKTALGFSRAKAIRKKKDENKKSKNEVNVQTLNSDDIDNEIKNEPNVSTINNIPTN